MADDTAVRLVLAHARKQGRDVVEALISSGLVLTPKLKQQIVMEALQDLRRDMTQWTPAQYLRRVNKDKAPSATDMYRAVLGYLDDYVRKEGEK